MKVGDFTSAKYLYMLSFWTAMFIPTTEFLQTVGSRYLDSYTPDVPRVRTGFGLFFFSVKLARETSGPSSLILSVSKHHGHYNTKNIIN